MIDKRYDKLQPGTRFASRISIPYSLTINPLQSMQSTGNITPHKNNSWKIRSQVAPSVWWRSTRLHFTQYVLFAYYTVCSYSQWYTGLMTWARGWQTSRVFIGWWKLRPNTFQLQTQIICTISGSINCDMGHLLTNWTNYQLWSKG